MSLEYSFLTVRGVHTPKVHHRLKDYGYLNLSGYGTATPNTFGFLPTSC